MIELDSHWYWILCARALSYFLAFGSSVPMGIWGIRTKFSLRVPQREINCNWILAESHLVLIAALCSNWSWTLGGWRESRIKYYSEWGISWHELSTVSYIRWPIYLSSKHFTSYLTFHLSLTLSPQQFSVLPVGRICFWLYPSRIPPIRMRCMVQVICWVAGWLLSHTTAWKMHVAHFLSAWYQFERNMMSQCFYAD